MLEKSPTGRIDVIFGPMFAGKSSELLTRVKALEVLPVVQAQCHDVLLTSQRFPNSIVTGLGG